MFAIDELIRAAGAKSVSGARSGGVSGISIDSRTIKPGEAFIAIRGGNFDGHDFAAEAVKKGCRCIIAEKKAGRPAGGGNVTRVEVADTVKALGAIARFYRRKFSIPVIAVTGSSGKTTTKDMIAWVLSQSVKVLKNEGTKNNHIGVPLTLLNLTRSHDALVLELGSNHPGEIGTLADICEPEAAVITNAGPSHLEHFGSLRGVLREKYALVERLRGPSIAVLNADDNLLRKKMSSKRALRLREGGPFIVSYAVSRPCDFRASKASVSGGLARFSVNKKYAFTLRTIGYYNIYNALAAVSIARIMGTGYGDIAKRLSVFEFPAGRLKDAFFHGVRFIDDTYNSNPLSLSQALRALGTARARGRKILVMGDMLELGAHAKRYHSLAGREAAASCDALVAVGNFAKTVAQAATRGGLDARRVFACGTAREAGDILFGKLSCGSRDIVLVKGSRLLKMEALFKR